MGMISFSQLKQISHFLQLHLMYLSWKLIHRMRSDQDFPSLNFRFEKSIRIWIREKISTQSRNLWTVSLGLPRSLPIHLVGQHTFISKSHLLTPTCLGNLYMFDLSSSLLLITSILKDFEYFYLLLYFCTLFFLSMNRLPCDMALAPLSPFKYIHEQPHPTFISYPW